MWQVGRSSTRSTKYTHIDVDYENGMNIVICTIPAVLLLRAAHIRLSACPSGVEPAWVPNWNPDPVIQGFFNAAFNWDSPSLQPTFSTTAPSPAKLTHESTSSLCPVGWLLGYMSVCLVLLWQRSPVQDQQIVKKKSWFIWIKGHYKDKYLKKIK